MGLLFCDGFDNYGNIANMARGRWYGISSDSSFRAGRFHGKSWATRGGSLALGANLDYGVLGFASQGHSFSNDYVYDVIYKYVTGSIQDAVMVRCDTSSGVISIYTTSLPYYQFALVSSSAPGIITDLSWYYLEIKIDAASGVQVRVNGAVAVTFSGSLSGTESGGTFNIVTLGSLGTNLQWIDDLYFCDSSTDPGPRAMNDYLGDKRVYTMFPTANATVQFTPVADVTYAHTGTNNGNNLTTSANLVYLPRYVDTEYISTGTTRRDQSAIIAKQDSTLASITLRAVISVPGIHIRPVVYTEDPINVDQPLTLLAIGDETTGLAAGVNIVPFGSTAPTLTKGVKYWIGFVADAGFSTPRAYQGGWQSVASTYPAAPTTYTWASATSVAHSIIMDYTITTTNYGMVQEDDADAISYNSTGTLNDQDLFDVGPTLSSSAVIFAVQVTGSYRKDDANLRSIANLIKSDATQDQGADLALNADYKYASDVWVLNPDTTAEWTPAEVNAAKIGYKVTI